jgi:hypothetical protein
MCKSLFFKLLSLSFIKETTNWTLGYITSQPVNLDLFVLLILALEFTGLWKLQALFTDAKEKMEEESDDDLILTEMS